MSGSLRVALRALGANKLRTCLTMLGIIIGVAAVIALMSVGRGAQVAVTSQINSLGTNLLFIRPGSINTQGVRTGAGQAPTLTVEDSAAIATLPGIEGVAPELNGGRSQLVVNGQNWSTSIDGVTPEYQSVRNTPVASGDWISAQQLAARSTVVVLGDTVAQQLFADDDPIGQSVRVAAGGRSIQFRVIGVAQKKGGSGFGSSDDQIWIPLSTMRTKVFSSRTSRGGQNVTNVNVQVADEKQMQTAVADVGELLRTRHKTVLDDVTIQSQEDILSSVNQITGTFTLLLGAIAGISLVVGGIGIMNIMLVSVTERTREIGIRKAVGARRGDILSQFLVESVVVSILGGALGIAIGWGLSTLVSRIQIQGQTLTTIVGLDSIGMAFGVSAAVGLFFGIYPASRAASLNPIEALRYE